MSRNDDDFEDDDRPRRRRPRDDEDDDRPSRSRRRRDEDDDDRPSRSRGRRDEYSRPGRPKKSSSLPLVLGIVGAVFLLCCGGGGFALYYFGGKVTSESRAERESSNNLRQIGLAIHHHHDQLGTLPNNSYDPAGKPLLSWRVHLLRQLDEPGLYAQFRLDEPWDSPNNKPLIAKMPKVFAPPSSRTPAGDGRTYYRGFSHQGALFERPSRPGFPNALNFGRINDGLANTIAVVEAGDAVEWTRPDDLDWALGRPMPPLGGGSIGDRVQVLLLDGSVRTFRKSMPEPTWRALTTYAGGEVVDPNW